MSAANWTPREEGWGPTILTVTSSPGVCSDPAPTYPLVPHPTLIGSDDDEDEYEDDDFDDGFDEASVDLAEVDDDRGAMFDTSIIRDDGSHDPRIFSLPPMFGRQEQQLKEKRRSKKGRLVPVVSENTFLSTNKRPANLDPDPSNPNDSVSSDLHLPNLSVERTALVTAAKAEEADEGQGQGDRKRKPKDPRKLNSERSDRKVSSDVMVERATRSDSAIEFGLAPSNTSLSREKTDPTPQPIVVKIKNQDGEVVQRIPIEDLPPGTKIPAEAFTDDQQRGGKPRRKKKKRRPQSREGSASPTFSGSITISRETTLSGMDSPDYFLSRLRSASWCECPEQRVSESRCGECRRVKDHEKWCVSRNSLCQSCGKAFKRKYSQLERKASFSTIPASSGLIITNNNSGSNGVTNSGSPSRNRHQDCSPTKPPGLKSASGDLLRETSGNRVRFQEDGKVVYPQWETFPDSGVEEDKDHDEDANTLTFATDLQFKSERKSYPPSLDANIHQRAYNMALADAKLKAMFPPKKSKSQSLQHPDGVYFSYFPLLKRKKPPMITEIAVSPTPPQESIGLRADVREGRKLKVKKGLKHILGAVKLDDYYPGGKRYPKQ